MREGGVDPLDGLSKPAPADCRASAARVVRDHQSETLIKSTRPQRGLAQTGVPHQGNPLAIDLRVGLEVVRPDSNPKPNQRWKLNRQTTHIRFRRGIKAMDSIFEAIMKIRVYVSVIHCGKGIAPIQNGLDCPT